MSERHPVLNKDLSQWTPEDFSEYLAGIVDDMEKAIEGNNRLRLTLLHILRFSIGFTISENINALKREAILREDLRACIEEVAGDHVEFQFTEFSRRNQEEINHMQNRIESLNNRLDRYEDL